MKKYTIKKGNHYCFHLPSLLPVFAHHTGIKKLKFRFKFDRSCLFQIVDTDDQDINKLYGWSLGYHKKDSVRVGWKPDDQQNCDKIALHFYIHNNWKFIYPYFATIDVDKWYEMEISIPDGLGSVQFILKDGETGLFLSQASAPFIPPKFKWGYRLFFYAGGDKPARQDWTAWIDEEEIK